MNLQTELSKIVEDFTSEYNKWKTGDTGLPYDIVIKKFTQAITKLFVEDAECLRKKLNEGDYDFEEYPNKAGYQKMGFNDCLDQITKRWRG